jgi:hypothetical protein
MAEVINSYDTKDQIRITGLLASAAGVLTDPTTLVFKVLSPSGEVTTYTYGSDAFPIRISAGTYYIDVTPTEPGHWAYRFESSGTGQAADEGRFWVRASRVAV